MSVGLKARLPLQQNLQECLRSPPAFPGAPGRSAAPPAPAAPHWSLGLSLAPGLTHLALYRLFAVAGLKKRKCGATKKNSQTWGISRAWRRVGPLGKGHVIMKEGRISTQDDAAQQEHKKHPQQQPCHPDGPTWRARREGMWVSTEPLPASKRLLSKPPPCWSQAPLSPSHQGNQLSKARRRESLGGGGVRTGPGSHPDLCVCPLWALVPWERQLPGVASGSWGPGTPWLPEGGRRL